MEPVDHRLHQGDAWSIPEDSAAVDLGHDSHYRLPGVLYDSLALKPFRRFQAPALNGRGQNLPVTTAKGRKE
jgi:hypothetical protein